jgi:hypothetical protein
MLPPALGAILPGVGIVLPPFVVDRDDGEASRRSERLAAPLGRTGRSLTPLWPSGLAEFDGLRVDAIADGDELIAGWIAVQAIRLRGGQVFMRVAPGRNGGPIRSGASRG